MGIMQFPTSISRRNVREETDDTAAAAAAAERSSITRHILSPKNIIRRAYEGRSHRLQVFSTNQRNNQKRYTWLVCLFFTLLVVWVIGMIVLLSHHEDYPHSHPYFSVVESRSHPHMVHFYPRMTTAAAGMRSLRTKSNSQVADQLHDKKGGPRTTTDYHKTGIFTLHAPEQLMSHSNVSLSPSHGGLRMDELDFGAGFIRKIQHSYYVDHSKGVTAKDKNIDPYYAVDDDVLRANEVKVVVEGIKEDPPAKESTTTTTTCHRTHDYRQTFPSCNEFHHLDRTDVLGSDHRFVNNGAFREVFAHKHFYAGSSTQSQSQSQPHPQPHLLMDQLAIKEILFEEVEGADLHEYIEYSRMDALVAERLTASPRVYDIYGYCGIAILSQFFYHGDIEARSFGGDEDGNMKVSDLSDSNDVDPQNDLTGAQKLVLALDMAEGLADLHGYMGGLIIHDDVQMSQFLLNENKTRLILNDFNRAELPLWDDHHQEYCRYANGKGHGNWRSPEEYKDQLLTEAIDIWSLGANLYALLTGLSPLYELDDKGKQEKARKQIVRGKTGYIDPRYSQRSDEEAVLVKLIKPCFAYYAKDRPSIFTIVNQLQSAVHDLLESKGISRGSVLQDL